MRRLIVGMIATGCAAAGLAADRVELPGFYGNTWEMTRPEQTVWIYINADGTWDGIFGGTFQNGYQWRTIDGNTCFVSPPSAAEQESLCFGDLAKRKVGDSWQQTAVGRDKVWNSTIHKGRTVPPTKP